MDEEESAWSEEWYCGDFRNTQTEVEDENMDEEESAWSDEWYCDDCDEWYCDHRPESDGDMN